MIPVTLVHLSDLHFGRDCDLKMIDAVERIVPTLDASAVVVSGDLTQRARHGEFQAARRFLEQLGISAPVLTLPGNHDVQWFESPFWQSWLRPGYVKYRRWFGENLTPTLVIPGAVIATVLTSHGVSFPSMTPNLNDMAVKGHLPSPSFTVLPGYLRAPRQTWRGYWCCTRTCFAARSRSGWASPRWKTAQDRLIASGARRDPQRPRP